MTSDEKKYFQETFEIARENIEKFKRRLKSSKFNREQRKVLEAFFFYQKRNKEEVFKRIRNTQMQDPYLEATRNYVLGLAFNHFGNYSFAIEKLTLAVEQYELLGEKESTFYPIVFLVLAYANKKDIKNLEKYSKQMYKYVPKTEHQQMSQVHAQIVFLVTVDKHEEASVALEKALEMNNFYLKDYKPGLLILKFMLALKNKEYDQCHDVLIEYKKTNGFAVRANYLYMKSLFNHLFNGSPLYVYENELEDCLELREHLEVIKALSRSDEKRALHFWQKLEKHNPSLYGENFRFNGDFCLFSIALEKYRKNILIDLDLNLIDDEKLSPYEKLEIIFQNESITVSKEKLIEMLWCEEPSELTMARLRKLISRFNRQKNTRIVSYQDTYKRVS